VCDPWLAEKKVKFSNGDETQQAGDLSALTVQCSSVMVRCGAVIGWSRGPGTAAGSLATGRQTGPTGRSLA
jgi:hypothetical protein